MLKPFDIQATPFSFTFLSSEQGSRGLLLESFQLPPQNNFWSKDRFAHEAQRRGAPGLQGLG